MTWLMPRPCCACARTARRQRVPQRPVSRMPTAHAPAYRLPRLDHIEQEMLATPFRQPQLTNFLAGASRSDVGHVSAAPTLFDKNASVPIRCAVLR